MKQLSAFFTFLRISKLVQHIIGGFDNTRHFSKGGTFFCSRGLKILNKWTKTLQTLASIHEGS